MYQLPALRLPAATVVVSPLISLMKDRTDKLNEAGAEAAALDGTLGAREEEAAVGSRSSWSTRRTASPNGARLPKELLDYFEREEGLERCGSCDKCRA